VLAVAFVGAVTFGAGAGAALAFTEATLAFCLLTLRFLDGINIGRDAGLGAAFGAAAFGAAGAAFFTIDLVGAAALAFTEATAAFVAATFRLMVSLLALPSPQAFVDPTVRVISGFCRR
jgi:hypothetical protein